LPKFKSKNWKKSVHEIFRGALIMYEAHRSHSALQSTGFFLLSWNVLKGKREGWQEDLQRLGADADLLLLQEALLHDEFYCHLGQRLDWHVTEGYRHFNRQSGILTASVVGSHRKQSFVHKEPIFRTPKAALITEYSLLDHPHTLLVANIHAINFTWGVFRFHQQLNEVFSTIAAHQGPVVLAGDFNVWRGKRMQLLRALVADARLIEVDFLKDCRKSAFNYQLDHIFYRGLRKRESAVHAVSTSDHNPITAIFSID